MTTYTVNSTAQLISALRIARDSDVIAVAAGTYSGVSIRNINIAGNVTVTSADPNNQAVFTDLMVRGSSGISFTDLDMAAQAGAASNSFQVYGSSRIAFDRIALEGPANLGSGAEQSAFMIRNSQTVSITDSEFSNLWHGVSLLDNNGVVLTGNYFHDIRTDGIRGGGTSNLVIANNLFTDFYPAPGDHPDAIQLWTTNTKASAHSITITDNVVVRGEGGAMQGIFLRDLYGTLPFKDVTITGNIVTGGMYNGISVGGVAGGSITGNTVLGFPDQRSWIRAEADSNLLVADNTASDYVFINDIAGRHAANAQAQVALDGGGAAVAQWLGQHAGLRGGWGDAGDVMSLLGLVAGTTAASQAEVAKPLVVVRGTDGNDRLIADAKFDSRVEGGAGNDVITGGLHDQQLVGGQGDDTYTIRSTGDGVIEHAEGGYDTVAVGIDYTLADHVEALRMTGSGQTGTGNALDNRLVGSVGDDRLFGLAGDDWIQGGNGSDQIDGGLGADTLRGEAGADTLRGGDGNDTLSGGDGGDTLFGDVGNDLFEGGTGNDFMTGAAGVDTFRFRSEDLAGGQRDTITDFRRGVDIVSLSLADANTRTVANDAFKFIGNQAFRGVAGELRYEVSNGAAYVFGDVNGDGVADFSLALLGVTSLSASDFVL